VLRINRDGTIPSDNPFPSSPVYTLGHRNNFGIAFDNDGRGIVTENGDARYDEINLLAPGANYGFPYLQPIGKAPETANSSSVPPIRSYKSTSYVAPTQAIFYSSNKFPILTGKFIFGAYNGPELFSLELNNTSKKVAKELVLDTGVGGPIIAIGSSPLGDIYFGGTEIYKIEKVSAQPERQIMFPITIKSRDGVRVDNVLLESQNNSMVVDIHVEKPITENLSSPDIHMQIPKGLISDVSGVFVQNLGQNAQDLKPAYFAKIGHDDLTEGFTDIDINYKENSDIRLVIQGDKVLAAN